MSCDKQCSSCGGFCGRGGCKRDNVKPPTRKPLTDSELWAMWVESPSDVLRFARAIERAHGIGGEE